MEQKKYNSDDNQWQSIFLTPFRITKDSTLLWFQTTINHKILATNTFLYKIKVSFDPKCTLCSSTDY